MLIALAAPLDVRGETIYAAWNDRESHTTRLTHFDSETPWLHVEIPLSSPVPLLTLAFDHVTRKIYGFDAANCQVTCPPYNDPVIVDPFSGDVSSVHLPGLSTSLLNRFDTDIDPLVRELRYFDPFGENYRYSLDALEVHQDLPLNPLIYVGAIAYRWVLGDPAGVETYVIGHFPGRETDRVDSEAPLRGGWLSLARIGGPGGIPPPSSGEVTWIGNFDVFAERMGFDISASGVAYLGVFNSLAPEGAKSKLYTVDLQSGALQEVALFAPPGPRAYLTGIAVAPPVLPSGAPEIPALSHIGLTMLSLLLASAALWRSRFKLS